jgi:hypothetical protein
MPVASPDLHRTNFRTLIFDPVKNGVFGTLGFKKVGVSIHALAFGSGEALLRNNATPFLPGLLVTRLVRGSLLGLDR